MRTYDNIRGAGQGDDYATGCLLDYNYFINYCLIIKVLDFSQRTVKVLSMCSTLLFCSI